MMKAMIPPQVGMRLWTLQKENNEKGLKEKGERPKKEKKRKKEKKK